MNAPGMMALAVADIAREAGRRILEIYQGDFAVERKDDCSPLTAADMAAHRIIVAALPDIEADLPVLSEESTGIAWPIRQRWSRYWLVDPLDGTREFVKRNGEFTVNIALIEHGVPVLGVVHAPVDGYTALGERGQGAWRVDDGTRPMRTRATPVVPVVAGSRSHGSQEELRFLEALGEHQRVALGSSLKFCLIAEGRADVYLRYGATSEWDTAAAQCVLEAAGGRVTDFDGRPLTYNRGESLINPSFIASGDSGHDWLRYLP
ncbi:MAG TPA: 3'(2'),5'-bisphosphate nucleotidase CysQ [Xanthomonadaceae bacterium]|nr:3'(2'),5'-bisphosphate nucleotidase CysQ [Xanthomonadaceae bacterium]